MENQAPMTGLDWMTNILKFWGTRYAVIQFPFVPAEMWRLSANLLP